MEKIELKYGAFLEHGINNIFVCSKARSFAEIIRKVKWRENIRCYDEQKKAVVYHQNYH